MSKDGVGMKPGFGPHWRQRQFFPWYVVLVPVVWATYLLLGGASLPPMGQALLRVLSNIVMLFVLACLFSLVSLVLTCVVWYFDDTGIADLGSVCTVVVFLVL